jgi:exosortase
MMSISERRKLLIQGGIIIGVLVILYAPVLKKLVHDWIHLPDFSHGFLVPVLSGYFVYIRKNQLASLRISGEWTGFGVILLGAVTFILGRLAAEEFTVRASLIIVFSGLILFHFGREHLRSLRFPLIFLILMIPIPSLLMDQLTFPLQFFVSMLASKCLDVVGIPTLREGNIIALPNTSLQVVEACSGIRSIISLLALSVVFAHFTQKTRLGKILLVFSTLPVSIFANAGRVFGTGVLAYFYGNWATRGFFHEFSGWLIFLVTSTLLFAFGSLLTKTKVRVIRRG